MIKRHRYHKHSTPSDSRTLPIYGDPISGDGLDAGKYYRCWNCGFVCNVDRDALGDAQSRDGVAIKGFIETPERDGQGPLAHISVLGDSINHYHVAMENGVDGQPKAIRHSQVAQDGSGCPHCMTRNWKGDY